ncbi:restriction endonuclease subunit S [Acinetobacter soli]|uniref:restriction endonuclease subunit S n=1 Tax=Acinetobacter soli TaxID=487316 RepID=UPI00125EEC11|nr:restriction endonuclease subunit S [Acinetobacter soli]
MNSYRTSTWGDEISLEYGKSLKGYQNSNGTYQVFGSNGPIGWTDKPLCKGPGIILGRKGAYRGVKFSEQDFYVIDTAYYVVPKTDIDLNWLYYAIKYHKLGEIDDGSPIPSTTRAAVYVREFDIPSKEVQVKIGNILKKIDLKIELNNQINETLESIAQALFKSWFIDFDPVRAKIAAKQEGKDPEHAAMCAISGKSEAELKQMAEDDFVELQATAALFPDELMESELGEVPKGWEVSTIENCFHVVMGQSPKGETYNENQQGKIFFQGRAEFGWRYPSPRLYTTDPKRIAKMNDILLSVRAPVGDMNVALDECCIGRGLAALSHKSNHFSYSYYLLKSLKNKFDLFNGEGTVFGSINQKDLKNITLIEPNRNLIDRFAELVFMFDQKIKINSLNISQLIDIRDTLLPKLLSGELDVSCVQDEVA